MTTMEGTVELLAGMTFRARSGSGHAITLDAAPEVGGGDHGARPMELLLLGLGGCTAMDVISILRKMGQDVTGYSVRVRGERVTTHPQVFRRISVEHVVTGRDVSPHAVHRAVELSATRYCSAAAMLREVAEIAEGYRVIDEETGAETTGSLPSLDVATT